MITFEPYTTDALAREALPEEHRWIYNRLQLAKTFNYAAGPITERIPKTQSYILRPIVRIGGGSVWYRRQLQKGTLIEQFDFEHDYMWQEDYGSRRGYTEFIDDIPIHSWQCNAQSGRSNWRSIPIHVALPNELRGISKFFCIETVDGRIIEAFPRLLACAMIPEIAEEYPPTTAKQPGIGRVDEELLKSLNGGKTWVIDKDSRDF